MIRQGDCGLIECDSVPKDAVEVPKEGGRHVLLHGEATGHAHAFHEPSVRMYKTPKGRVYLRLVETSLLRHEEHSPASVPPGIYTMPRQTEWTDAMEPRVVVD